jgi:hypothetical protein
MELHYLDFEFSDEDSGRGSFDAMASVVPRRLPPLLEEIAAVLRWAHAGFGTPASLDDGGEWDFDLQAVAEPDRPLPVRYDAGRGEVELGSWDAALRVTLTLTLGGSPAFCNACREAFVLS